MPEPDTVESGPAADSAPRASVLDATVEGVVARWNPAGMDLLRRVHAAAPTRRAVALCSPYDDGTAGAQCAGTDALRAELARLNPPLDLVASPLEAVVAVALLDAGSVLGRAELAALAELLESGNRVLFALADVQAHRDWRVVRDRDAALLARFATRGDDLDLRIWPVSAQLSAISRAIRRGELGRLGSDRAELVLAGSGLRQLHAAVWAALPTDPADIRARHLDRARVAVLRQTVRGIRTVADTLRGEDAATSTLRVERTQLAARRDGGRAEVMAALRTQLQLARVDLLHDTGVRVRAANTAARAELDELGHAHLDDFGCRLKELVAALTEQVDRDIHDRMADLSTRIDPAGGALPTGTAVIRSCAPEVADRTQPRQRSVEDRMMILLGASAGVGLGRLAVWPMSLVPALDLATVPMTLALGGAIGWWLTRSRKHLADRSHVRQWAIETLVDVRAQLEQRVVAALVETESLLSDHIARSSAGRMVEVDRRIAEISSRVRDAVAQRSGKLTACERDLAAITRALAAVDAGQRSRPA